MTSKEANVFRKYCAKVSDAIDSPADFAKDFSDKGLISVSTRDAASEVSNARTREDKAILLTTAVERMVKTDPGQMRAVLEVLHSHVTTKRLAKVMAEEGIF